MPKVYRDTKYYDLEDLKKEIAEGLYDEFGNKLTNWISYEDRDKKYVYVPCKEDFFHWYRNQNRNEERRNFREMERCPISIDQMREDHDFEYADNSYYENQERERAQEVSDLIWSLVSEFDSIDQEIIRLYNEGHTDSYISQQVNIPRSTIQWRKRMVIELLKEKMNKIR